MTQGVLSFLDEARRKQSQFDGSGAEFSPDGLYRYLLWRPGTRKLPFCMLNPSTADELKDDPTIRRCRGYARDMGREGVVIANIFAYRSTAPQALYDLADPIGPDNDAAILRAAAMGDGSVVCAWGNHGALHDRGAAVVKLLRAAGYRPMAFGYTKDGHPWHPLYLKAELRPQDMP